MASSRSSLIFTVASRYFSLLLQFAVLFLLARQLPAAEYGQYLLVLSVVMPTYFLVGIGASESYVRESPRKLISGDLVDVRRMSGSVYLSVGVVCTTVVVIAAVLISLGVLPIEPEIVWFGVAYFVANGIMFNSAQVLLGSGSERLAAFFYYPAVNISLAASLATALLFFDELTFTRITVASSIGAGVMCLICLAITVVKIHPARPQRGESRGLIQRGAPLTLSRALYTSGQWLPTLVAGVAISPTEAGVLGTAGRLAVAVAAVTAAMRFGVRPAIVRAYAAEDVLEIRRIVGVLAAGATAIALLAIVLNVLVGEYIIGIIFGNGMSSVAPILSILLVGVLAESFGGPVDEVLKMTGSERQVNLTFMLGLPMLTIALFVGAQNGTIAIAVTQVLYTASVVTILILLTRRKLGIWVHPILSARTRT